MEAMSMEIPCIAACINGIPELIRDGARASSSLPRISGALGAAIARLRDDAALRESLGKAGRAAFGRRTTSIIAQTISQASSGVDRVQTRPLRHRLSQILPRTISSRNRSNASLAAR
jgi:hypothetical protein